MKGIENVGRIFSSPGRVAQSIAERPDWRTPVVVIVLASIVMTLAMLPYQGEARREMLEKYAKDTGREIDIEDALKPTVGRSIGAVVGLLFLTGVFLVVGAAVLNGLSMLSGGKPGFGRMFAFFSYAMVIPAVGGLIKIPLVVLKKDPDVRLSLGAFFPSIQAQSSGGILLSSTDIFSIWALAASVIGFGVLTGLSRRKSAAIVIGLYVVLVMIWVVMGLATARLMGR